MPDGAPRFDPHVAMQDDAQPEGRGRPTRTQVVLFLLTCVSTFAVSFVSGGGVLAAVAYSGSIMGILFAHEMGHYLTCARYGVRATLPYFLPFPLSLFGTLGAVILMRGRIPDRRVLFDIAVAGPILGLVVAVPVLVIGVALSTIQPEIGGEAGISLGEPLLLQAIVRLVVGPIPEGSVLFIHPVGLAGWAGLFVTALNLLPIGQLDGGHVLYGMFGPRVTRFTLPMLGALAILAVATGYLGWAILATLLAIFTMRRPHPPTLSDREPLDARRFAIGVAMLVVFALCFTPRPITIP